MRQRISCTMRAAVAVLVVAASTGYGRAAEPVLEAVALEKMSAAAVTASDHARVAKQYRLRAESLETKAKQHEQEARRLGSGHNPMAVKWPAMGRAAAERESRLAVQARRAAQECLARADRHIRLAVEAQLAG